MNGIASFTLRIILAFLQLRACLWRFSKAGAGAAAVGSGHLLQHHVRLGVEGDTWSSVLKLPVSNFLYQTHCKHSFQRASRARISRFFSSFFSPISSMSDSSKSFRSAGIFGFCLCLYLCLCTPQPGCLCHTAVTHFCHTASVALLLSRPSYRRGRSHIHPAVTVLTTSPTLACRPVTLASAIACRHFPFTYRSGGGVSPSS